MIRPILTQQPSDCAAPRLVHAPVSWAPLWCALLFGALALIGCGGDPATPDECADYPQYDIRGTGKDQGAVQDVGTVENSPLTQQQQRELQRQAAKGCITLPHEAFSLKSLNTSESEPATAATTE